MVAPTVGEAERLHGGNSSARLLPTLELAEGFGCDVWCKWTVV
jgi:hypothetical protein